MAVAALVSATELIVGAADALMRRVAALATVTVPRVRATVAAMGNLPADDTPIELSVVALAPEIRSVPMACEAE